MNGTAERPRLEGSSSEREHVGFPFLAIVVTEISQQFPGSQAFYWALGEKTGMDFFRILITKATACPMRSRYAHFDCVRCTGQLSSATCIPGSEGRKIRVAADCSDHLESPQPPKTHHSKMTAVIRWLVLHNISPNLALISGTFYNDLSLPN